MRWRYRLKITVLIYRGDVWPGQSRWSWTCCSSLKVRGWCRARRKKPPLRPQSGLIYQVRRSQLRPRKGSSRTPQDTSLRARWAPCRSVRGRKPRRTPRGGPVPAWQRVPGSALAPWSDRWSCAHWYNPVAPWRFLRSRSPGPDSLPALFPSLSSSVGDASSLCQTPSPAATPLPPVRLSWFWDSVQTAVVINPADLKDKRGLLSQRMLPEYDFCTLCIICPVQSARVKWELRHALAGSNNNLPRATLSVTDEKQLFLTTRSVCYRYSARQLLYNDNINDDSLGS